MTLPDEVRPLLESSALAHLVTLEPDGSPQVSGVWVGLDGDDIVFASMMERRKITNLRRDPRVALSVEGTGVNERGLLEYAVIHGTAEIVPGGAAPLLARLADTYLGPDSGFPPTDDASIGFVVHITVTKVGGVGPWAD